MCFGDEDKGDFSLVFRELDQKFYYWSVLGRARRKFKAMWVKDFEILREEKHGITGRQRTYFSF